MRSKGSGAEDAHASELLGVSGTLKFAGWPFTNTVVVNTATGARQRTGKNFAALTMELVGAGVSVGCTAAPCRMADR
jgi:hypothetical protein